MPWVPEEVERRIFGAEDRHDDPAPVAGGELLVWIPEQLAPRLIRALNSVADLVEQRHGALPIVELTREAASLVRKALVR